MRICWIQFAVVFAFLAVRPGTMAVGAEPQDSPVDFNRDIRPILSDTCFKCHGFDEKERQAGLRLDRSQDARAKLESGETAIVPHKPDQSELVRRIESNEPELQMPPPTSGKKLTAAQVALLKRWVSEGGKYADHWSFVPPGRATPTHLSGARGLIDGFVIDRQRRDGLSPRPEAASAELARRATLDLTGLPPTLAELDAFAADLSPDAYERLVDRLLASPRYGERMAVDWLDAARYADTHGYHIDSHRDMWRWRDWVIAALNHDMPFDLFTIEQLAGDLLPNATVEQQLASGFNRNHMINYEGGAIPEEYLNAYIVDRVNTLGMVWLGLTVNCAQCHDHKYDPITAKEYYQLYAFFNNVPESGLDGQKGNASPVLATPTRQQQLLAESYKQRLATLGKQLDERRVAAVGDFSKWEAAERAKTATAGELPPDQVAHFSLDAAESPTTTHGAVSFAPGKVGNGARFDGNSWIEAGDVLAFERTDAFSFGAWIQPTANHHGAIVSRMDDENGHRGYDVYFGGGQLFVHLIHNWEGNVVRVNTKKPLAVNQWHHVVATYDGSGKAAGVQIYVNGKAAKLERTHDTLTDTIRTDKPFSIGRRRPGAAFQGLIDDVRCFKRALTAEEAARLAGADPIRPLLAIEPDKRSPEQQNTLQTHFLTTTDAEYKRLSAETAAVKASEAELAKQTPTTMVMKELEKPRDTFMLVRGGYDQRGEKVMAQPPAALPPLPAGAPGNRLGLARWLVAAENPLVARVAVNRYWQAYFGTGLVKTAEDYGSQGEWPSHPELLDWLAREFVDGGWQVKGMQRRIVTSATYRQSSAAPADLVKKDPENRLLARGPRVRLSAEFIRDQALAAGGLLDARVGGPSVSPYHPAGLWEEMAFGGGFTAQTYQQSKGEDLYRRTMYTFWKRTVPPASLATFDAPDREVCTVRRLRTNTPLQALVLMNDPTYVEAARKLAERIMKEGGATPRERIGFAFRMATSRTPHDREAEVLAGIYEKQLTRFRADAESAKKLLATGESKRDESLDAAELAAWTVVASVILNLDETITKG